jgi:mRNA interferase MazF
MALEKDYRLWTPLKRQINSGGVRLYFHEREIWQCHIGENIGFEQDGRGELYLRPIVVVKKFNHEVFWGVPLTRTEKKYPFYFTFSMRASDDQAKSTAILSQIRLMDARRLRRLIGTVPKGDFVALKAKLKALLP